MSSGFGVVHDYLKKSVGITKNVGLFLWRIAPDFLEKSIIVKSYKKMSFQRKDLLTLI